MSETASYLIHNAHECFKLLHLAIMVWGVLMLANMFIPIGSMAITMKFPISDLSVPGSFARFFVLIGVLLCGLVACIALSKSRDILRLLKEDDQIAVRTFPSIATLSYRPLRLVVVLTLAFFQFITGAALVYVPDGSLQVGPTGFGVLFSIPMLWMAWNIWSWDRPHSKQAN